MCGHLGSGVPRDQGSKGTTSRAVPLPALHMDPGPKVESWGGKQSHQCAARTRGCTHGALDGTPRDGFKSGEGSSLVSQGTGRGRGYAQHMSNVRADSKPSLTGTADGSNGLRAPKQTYSLTSLTSRREGYGVAPDGGRRRQPVRRTARKTEGGRWDSFFLISGATLVRQP